MAAPRVTIDQLPEQVVPVVSDMWVVQSGGTTKRMAVGKIVDSIAASVDTHVNDTVDAHDASAISAVPNVDPMTGNDVQTQLSQAASRINSNATLISGNTTAINNHIAQAADAHDASAISVTAIAGVSASDVQAVLANLAARVATLEAAP